jgi:7-keto-8-aminopelargonate synthetase-like enzyme
MYVFGRYSGNYIFLEKKKYSYFAGNNYLGLANHPVIKDNATKAIKNYGVNFSASRNTTGTSELHIKLEKKIAEFKDKPASVLFASGYMGNHIMLHVLREQYTIVFIDESAHPSITDGIPNELMVFSYNHCDHSHLEALLTKYRKHKALVITDGIFALTGEIAPLDKIYPVIKKHNAILLVDDAHATGVLGIKGKGTPEYFQLEKEKNIYQTETMSKALGAYGGFIADDAEIIEKIKQTSSVYIGSTSVPPPLVAAGYSSLEILMAHPELRVNVLQHAEYLRKEIKQMGFLTNSYNTPIIPVFFNDRKEAVSFSDFLKETYIIVPYVNYPVKPEKFVARITVSAIHTRQQLEELLHVLKLWQDKYGTRKRKLIK